MRNLVRVLVSVFAIVSAEAAHGGGAVDPFYGDSGVATIAVARQSQFHGAALYPPDKVVGVFYTDPSDTPLRVYRASQQGIVDASFGTGGFVDLPLPGGFGKAIAVDPNGKILVAGQDVGALWNCLPLSASRSFASGTFGSYPEGCNSALRSRVRSWPIRCFF